MRQVEDENSADDDAGGIAMLGSGPAAPKKLLVIVHRRETNPGAIGQWLTGNGYRLDIRCPRFGDPLPPTLAGHAGAVVFGGPMSANDPDDYIRAEIDWLAVPLRENKPFFGVCLGAQMLAKHLGAEVSSHPGKIIEVGYYPITPSEAGAALTQWPDQVYQWHQEGFTLPWGARRLASGSQFENQAIQYGEKAFGVQFHPEMTLAMIHRWTTVAAHRLASPGARSRAEHIMAHCVHGEPQRAWLDRFMRIWLGQVAARQG
ncbi:MULTISPECIES: glutamine amidotransferase [Rhodomicrobium]|uniref:glutamine amidotransferase n=1 Tax=Rhodomicrobium TaxID=1068 RepID=UPI001FD96348|nr:MULTISPECIES: glutamine amidotransferase [Rhodomicrobium]